MPDSVQPTPTAQSNDSTESSINRRTFLASASTLAMAGGLAAGYGTFFAFAGEFLYPEPDPGAWYFVARTADLQAGGSLPFESPQGVMVVIKRDAAAQGADSGAEQFQALSSVCPHLGCRVHWEPHNNRFFCPCHNGEFDAEGRPTGGPPKTANQHLARYPLKVEEGLLFLRLPTQTVNTRSSQKSPSSSAQGPMGHNQDVA
jgi:cytochrome b6-f complex iron-sulfur subunit